MATETVNVVIGNDVITNAMLANMPALTIKGNRSAAPGDPEDLTANQASIVLDGATDPFARTTVVVDGDAASVATAAADATTKANAAQAFSIQRVNHTGTQLASTISDFASAVRSTVLTGLSLASSAAVAATDTILEAFGKLQAFNNLFSTIGLAIARLSNPSAVTWLRVNADNSVTARTASETLTDIGAIGNSLIDAKGDLIVGASDNTPARLAVGGNGTVLMANSSATDGVEWVTRPVSLPVIFGLNGVTIAVTTTETVFNSTTVHQIQRDLTNYRQVRLVVNRQGTAGPTGAKAILKYRAGAQSTTVANFSDIGTSEVSCDIVTANTQAVSSWIDLAASAKADVMITVTLVCSSGTASPVIGAIEMQCR